MAVGSGVNGIRTGFGAGFGRSVAHGDGNDAGDGLGIIDGRIEIARAGGISFDQDDIRAGRDGVGPFDIEGDFTIPVGVLRRHGGGASLAYLCESEAGVGNAELLIETVEVGR
jgi:hypothetical protein